MSRLGVLLLLILFSWHAQAFSVYISVNGNDANDGRINKPVASIARALSIAKAKNKLVHVKVIFLDGTYYLNAPIVLNTADSNITFKAVEEGKAVISGGSIVKLKWKPYKNGIYVASLPAKMNIDQLYINGIRQVMARFPNAVANKNVYDTWDLSHKVAPDKEMDPINPKRVKTWSNPEGGYIHAMHNALWGDMHWVIQGKKNDSTLSLEGGWQNNRPSSMHQLYRIVENVFEELDSPGEWYYNKASNELYYMPAADCNLTNAKVEVVKLNNLITLNGQPNAVVSNVTFSGFVFKHTARMFMENKEPLLRSDWTISRTAAFVFNGASNCQILNCEFDQVGGNTILVNNYNTNINIEGCYIHHSGASGVVFVGDPKSVRSPLFRYGPQNYKQLDTIAGPANNNYPSNCSVRNCLITKTGRYEKQTAPIHISMSFGIKVSHCSIYDVPRAGININEGTFGGHTIEYCDVFNTVLETGDHGSFNSWGRDRYWSNSITETSKQVSKSPNMPFWDMLAPITINNNRMRCDHGWDIDLDDGSTYYIITNNLLLRGGLKLREGYHRTVTNNIILNNSLHPHVWYKNSNDVFARNIVFNRYYPAIMNADIPDTGKWGKLVDSNLFVTTVANMQKFRVNDCDVHSQVGNPNFINPAIGNFSVADNSPALLLGFRNFAMNQFGVTKPSLKAIAKQPTLPEPNMGGNNNKTPPEKKQAQWLGVTIRLPEGSEMSAFGVAFDAGGVALATVSEQALARKVGFLTGDLILEVNHKPIKSLSAFCELLNDKSKNLMHFKIIRNQTPQIMEVNASLVRCIE